MQYSQRNRTGRFDWARLRFINSPMPAVGVYERPNTELMKMLVDMYPDEQLVRDYSGRLKEKRDAVLQGGGEQYQEYEQKDLSLFAPDDYHGTTKIGRAYSKSLFPRLPSKILNTIYKETHMELDMKCATSTLLCEAFADCQTEVMDRYVADPDSIYAELGMPKHMGKKLINSIICSYPNVAENPDIGYWAELSRNEVVMAIKRDVGAWATSLRERYPKFYEMVAAKCDVDDKRRHVDGTALSYFASDMEHSVMRAVLKFVFPEPSALNNIVWKYDGLIIPKAKLAGITHEQFIQNVEQHVQDSLGLHATFRLNHLADNSYGICLHPDREDTGDAYDRWKGKFEKKYAKLAVPQVFMMFYRGGKMWTDLNRAQFDHNNMEQPKEFVKRWLEDPDKRMYLGRDFIPPPLTISSDYLNLYRGIAASEIPRSEDPVDISLYLNHVRLLCGSNDENTTYLHKLIAQKIQSPGIKWRVMPIIMSAQGVGKDIWFDFIATVIGREQCIKDDGIHKFAGTNSHSLEGKLLCCLQEMGYKDTKEHEETLKALITNDTIQLEKKYVNSFVITNVVDFIGFTNQFNAINVSADDRRYFIVVADSTYAQQKEYMLPLLAFFHEDQNKRAVYDYYMDIDLDGFDSSADRPTTEAHKELMESNLSHADRFLKQALPIWLDMVRWQDSDVSMESETLKIKASLVNSDWMSYAQEMGIDKADKKSCMVQYFGRMMRELNGRTDAYKTEGHEKIVANTRSSIKHWLIDHRGLQAYLTKIFNELPTETANNPTAPPRRTAHHAAPGKLPAYEIKENGATVMGTDSLEEVNKALGEAYVETRGVEEFLIHQQRNSMEIPLGRTYAVEGGRAMLEAKYPFYIRDRTT